VCRTIVNHDDTLYEVGERLRFDSTFSTKYTSLSVKQSRGSLNVNLALSFPRSII
jgi:hypothetical protein